MGWRAREEKDREASLVPHSFQGTQERPASPVALAVEPRGQEEEAGAGGHPVGTRPELSLPGVMLNNTSF